MRSSSDSGLPLSSFGRNHPAMAMPAWIIQRISFQVADSIKCLSIRLMSGCASVYNASLTQALPTMAKAAVSKLGRFCRSTKKKLAANLMDDQADNSAGKND
jgi:hypothetical protein